MLFWYSLSLSLLTLVTEASVASDCMKFLVDEEFHIPCASLSATSRKPCLVSTAEDHDYLRRYGIVSPPGNSPGQMICAPKDGVDEVDCVSTKLRSSKTIEWMWTAWTQSTTVGVTTKSRTMSYTDNGVVKHCPYKETKPAPPIVLEYTLDDYGDAYVDGELIDDTLRYPEVKTVYLDSDTRLIAFKAVNIRNSGAVGPRAWLSTGVITDASSGWKCSRVYEEGWNQVGFDDSHWLGVDVQWAGSVDLVGHGAVTVGCGLMTYGPFYFRKTLIPN